MTSQQYPVLVAHRGYPSRYPENTLPGIEAAIHAGAGFVEFDIQMSRDRVPMLCHDSSLLRTGGIDRSMLEMTAAELEYIEVGETARLGSRFKGTTVPRLSVVLTLLSRYPSVQCFIEIKQESLEHFGRGPVMESVMSLVRGHNANCTIISFDSECLLHARQLGAARIGLVTESADATTPQLLKDMRPEFLFTSDACFSKLYGELSGDWQWVVYHTERPQRALELARLGANLVETNAIGEMLTAFGIVSE